MGRTAASGVVGKPYSSQMSRLTDTWSRDAIGYRQGELEDGDGVAAMVVAVIGAPALVVGSLLVSTGSLSMRQILLVAPLAALAGGFLTGAAGSMAAQTGGHSTWLLRPAFGRAGATLVSLVRLALVGLWAVIGLQLAGRWIEDSAGLVGMAVPALIAVVVVAALGILLLTMGIVGTVRVVIRRPLFISSVVLLALLVWDLVGAGGSFESGSGSFWAGVQLATEASVIFIPFAQALGRHLSVERDAMGGIAIGYAIPAMVVFLAGAIISLRGGGFPLEIFGLNAQGAAAIAVAWVVVAELDQAFAGFVASGAEATGIIRRGSTGIVGGVAVAGIVTASILLEELPLELATLAAAVAFPAALISVLDFHVARRRLYPESDLYGPEGTGGFVNVVGVGSWLVAVVLGQALDPIGPDRWVAMFADMPPVGDLPWRLLMAVVGGCGYLVLERWHRRRVNPVHDLRGLSS